jgi:hypothetical protein
VPLEKEKVRLLLCGLATHHAGLLPVYKALVEELFNENLIRVREGGVEGGKERGAEKAVASRVRIFADENLACSFLLSLRHPSLSSFFFSVRCFPSFSFSLRPTGGVRDRDVGSRREHASAGHGYLHAQQEDRCAGREGAETRGTRKGEGGRKRG